MNINFTSAERTTINHAFSVLNADLVLGVAEDQQGAWVSTYVGGRIGEDSINLSVHKELHNNRLIYAVLDDDAPVYEGDDIEEASKVLRCVAEAYQLEKQEAA